MLCGVQTSNAPTNLTLSMHSVCTEPTSSVCVCCAHAILVMIKYTNVPILFAQCCGAYYYWAWIIVPTGLTYIFRVR